MNAAPPRRMIRVVDGPYAGWEQLAGYAPYYALLRRGTTETRYERQDPPVEIDGVWWHHFAQVRP